MTEAICEKYKSETLHFLGVDGIKYLKEFYDEGELIKPWEMAIYGRVGMQVRNYLRRLHPEIDTEFPDYSDFEDWSWEFINDIMKDETI